MPQRHTPRIDERWIRHDWRMWTRPDFARWLKPGVDPADVIPGLARERAQRQAAMERARAAEDAELAAGIEHERRALAALNEQMREVNVEMARWRRRLAEEEAKYSPSQPAHPEAKSRRRAVDPHWRRPIAIVGYRAADGQRRCRQSCRLQ